MKLAIQKRIVQQLSQLIKAGSSYHIGRMAVAAQGIGAVGLDLPHAYTRFTVVFTAGDKGFGSNAFDQAAGVNCYLDAPYLSILESESETTALVRRLESMAAIPESERWEPDNDDGVFADSAIADLMEKYPAVDRVVRAELILRLKEHWLLDRIEDDLTNEIIEIREYS